MKLRILGVLVILSLSITGCSKNGGISEETDQNSEFVNYDIGRMWQIHKNTSDMSDDNIKYYSLKQMMISKTEKLIMEDSALNGIILDKENDSFDEYISSDASGQLYEFYTNMKTSENALSDFCFQYLKENYPDDLKGYSNCEDYINDQVKIYFNDVNNFENNPYLKDECEKYLKSFKENKNGWISGDYKDRFYCHVENLTQFIPSDAERGKMTDYSATYYYDKKSPMTLIQDLKNGQIIMINSGIVVDNIEALYSFDFDQYVENGSESAITETVSGNSIDDLNNENGVYFSQEANNVENNHINQDVQNAWNNSTFNIREDKVNMNDIDIPSLVDMGYMWKKNSDGMYVLYKTNYETGRTHNIIVLDKK